MKRLFNKYTIFMFILGALLFGTIGVIATELLAENISFKSKHTEWTASNVNKALNDLYDMNTSGGGCAELNLGVNEYYQLPKLSGDEFTYTSSDESIATVSSTGLITIHYPGKTNVFINHNGKKVLKYNVTGYTKIFKVTGGSLTSNTSLLLSPTQADLENITNYLTDGDTSKKGAYGALLLQSGTNYAWISFNLKAKASISFSSNYYRDSAGTSGEVAKFYKKNDDNTYTLVYELNQLNNTTNYGAHVFEAGDYKLVGGGYYVEFDEFHVEILDE